MRAGVDPEGLGGFLRGGRFIPGYEDGFGGVDRAGGRGRHQRPFAGEEVKGELRERGLGQVFEIDGQLAGLFVRA